MQGGLKQSIYPDATPFPTAVSEWIRVLGSSNVDFDPGLLQAAETATFETTGRIPVILRPGSVDQVSGIVRIASRFRFPVYPVSSGKNWGYGSRVPPVSGCALIDLSRLNRITAFDENLGYVTVQPGVTQRNLFEFLKQKRSGLWMDATGSSPDCSLIGNAMERGFGHTPYADHFANVAGLEVVLANGEIVRTGHAGLAGAKTGPVYRWGAGPSLDGIFSQSNYGIVTEMTIWLMPAPDCFEAFFFQCDAEQGLEAIVESLRPLRLNGTLRSAVHIANDYKVLAGIRQFPWEENAPLTPDRMKALRTEMKFTRWSGSGALYGTAPQVAEARRLLRRALKGHTDKLTFLDDRKLAFAGRFQGVYKLLTGLDLSRTLTLVRPVFNLLKGVPTAQPLVSAYWRKRHPVPPDPNPDRDGCGLLWAAPIAPLRGTDAETLRSIAEPLLLSYGFEPQISFTLITERALACIISIGYDRDLPDEDRRAMDCYRALQSRLAAAGYYSYRLGVAGMDMYSADSAYGRLLRAIKAAVESFRSSGSGPICARQKHTGQKHTGMTRPPMICEAEPVSFTAEDSLTRDLVRGLSVARPAVYWTDLLLCAIAGWGAFAGAVASRPFSAWMISLTLVSTAALYRGLCFVHEISHQSHRVLPGFETAWNTLIGYPLLLPSFVYVGVHTYHHKLSTYGTERDPEYLPFAKSSAMTVLFAVESVFIPPVLLIRFLALAPAGLAIPPLHRWLVARFSSLTVNIRWKRDYSSALLRTVSRQTTVILIVWGLAIALIAAGTLPRRIVAIWVVVSALISFANTLRTLGAHAYEGTGESLDRAGQLADSIDTPGAFWTELWAPVGLRYHALHHYFPGVPYHNLPAAWRRLSQNLPANALYRRVQSPGLPHSLRALYLKGLR